jgi:hypothetical protein
MRKMRGEKFIGTFDYIVWSIFLVILLWMAWIYYNGLILNENTEYFGNYIDTLETENKDIIYNAKQEFCDQSLYHCFSVIPNDFQRIEGMCDTVKRICYGCD